MARNLTIVHARTFEREPAVTDSSVTPSAFATVSKRGSGIGPTPCSILHSDGTETPVLTASADSVRPAATRALLKRLPIAPAEPGERVAMGQIISQTETEVKDDATDTEDKFPTEEPNGVETAPVSPKDQADRGVPIVLTDSWLKRMHAAMEQRGWNQVSLARACGLSKPSVSRVYNNKAATTVLVSRVAEALELEDPSAQLVDLELQKWVYAGMRLRTIDAQEFAHELAKFTHRVAKVDEAEAKAALLDAMTPPTK